MLLFLLRRKRHCVHKVVAFAYCRCWLCTRDLEPIRWQGPVAQTTESPANTAMVDWAWLQRHHTNTAHQSTGAGVRMLLQWFKPVLSPWWLVKQRHIIHGVFWQDLSTGCPHYGHRGPAAGSGPQPASGTTATTTGWSGTATNHTATTTGWSGTTTNHTARGATACTVHNNQSRLPEGGPQGNFTKFEMLVCRVNIRVCCSTSLTEAESVHNGWVTGGLW